MKNQKHQHGDLRVSWVHVHLKRDTIFYVPVRNVEEAKLVINTLADYDLHLNKHDLKPDTNNMVVLEMWSQDACADGDDPWITWEDDEGRDIEQVMREDDEAAA